MKKIILLVITSLFLIATPAEADPLQEGLAAYNQGNYSKAATLFEQAAKQGNIHGQFNTGLMFLQGTGGPVDYQKALKWLKKAAEQGRADAQNEVGIMYSKGLGVTTDYKQAVYWYRQAAEQGDKNAQCNLGNMYMTGRGVLVDHYEAMKWNRMSADQGYGEAMSNLAYIYYEQGNYTQSYIWGALAAQRNVPGADRGRDVTASMLSRSQLQEAQRLVREWKPKYN